VAGQRRDDGGQGRRLCVLIRNRIAADCSGDSFLRRGWACAPLLRRLRFRGLGGRDASLLPAYEHLHGVFAFARLVGVFVGVR